MSDLFQLVKMRGFFVTFFVAISLIYASASFAGSDLVEICGNIDISQMSNQDALNLADSVFTLKHQSLPPKRSNCGMISGESFAICAACEDVPTDEMLKVMVPMLSQKSHQAYHQTWHRIRYGLGHSDQDNYIVDQIKNGWFEDNLKQFITERANPDGTLRGEDFLFMHRLMIKMVELYLTLKDQPCITPWENVPEKIDDATWPIPQLYNPKAQTEGVDAINGVRARMAALRTPSHLREVSLEVLGEELEDKVHGTLHLLYSGGKPSPYCGGYKDFPEGCDNLKDDATAPANKHFFKLHGLIDQFIGLWLKENRYQEISNDCSGKPYHQCYEWKRPWIGKWPTI
jgi:hypothetical protein